MNRTLYRRTERASLIVTIGLMIAFLSILVVLFAAQEIDYIGTQIAIWFTFHPWVLALLTFGVSFLILFLWVKRHYFPVNDPEFEQPENTFNED